MPHGGDKQGAVEMDGLGEGAGPMTRLRPILVTKVRPKIFCLPVCAALG